MEPETSRNMEKPGGDYYQAIFEAHPEAMLIYHRESGEILEINGKMALLWGYSPEEASHLKITDLGAIAVGEGAGSPWRLAQEAVTGEAVQQVWEARDRTGRQFRVEARLQPLRRNGGSLILAVVRELDLPPGAEVTGQDREALYCITHRKLMERPLRESEARYRIVAEGSLAGVYLVQDGKFRYVNPVLARVYGYEPEELIDRLGPLDLTHYEDRLRARTRMDNLLAGKAEPPRYTFTGLHKNGSSMHCEVLSRVVEYQGRPAIMGTVLDNTERWRAEEALRNSEAKYRTIFNSVNDAVFVLDVESGDILEFNEKFLELLGYSPEEVGRLKITGLCSEDPPYTAQDAVGWLRKAGEEGPQLLEWLAEDKAGRRFWVEVNLKRTRIGGIDRLLAVARDISERKEGEAERHRAMEELEHRVEERTAWLRRANARLLQEIEERKRAEEMLRLQRDLGVHLSGRVDLADTLRWCLEAAISISGMDGGGLYLVDQVTGKVELASHQGLSPAFAARISSYDVDSVSAHLIMTGEPIYARVQDLPGILDEGGLQEGLRSVAIIPVKHKDNIIACINVASRTHEEVPETARVALEAIASQVGSAIARVQAEEALRASEDRFRAFMHHLPGISFMMDARNRLVYLNQNLENILGKAQPQGSSPNFLGKTNEELWPQEIAHQFNAGGHRVLTRRESLQYIETFRQDDGLHHWLLHKFPILDREGSPVLVGGIGIDVTELQEAEKALRRAKRELELRVEERTAQLKKANRALQLELQERRRIEESLRRSEDRYRTLVEQIPAVTYTISVGKEAELQYISPQIETLLAFSPAEWLADPNIWVQQLHPDDRERVLGEINRSYASGAPFASEYRLLSKSGRVVWFRDEAKVVFDQEGKPLILQGLARDITESKAAEEALRESEAKYRTLVEQIPAITFISALDDVGTHLYISPQIQGVLGFTPEEWLADPERFKQQIHPEDRDRVLTELFLSYSKGGPFLGEYRMLSKSGRVVWVRDESRAVYDREGRPLFMQGVALDITARKRGEEALREATHKLRALVQASPLPIISINSQGKLMSWNPAAEQVFGWSEAEVLGRVLPIVPSGKQKEFWELRQRVSEGESLLGVELRRQRRDGSLIDVKLSTAPLFDVDGKLMGIMGIYEDISLRKRMEETVRQVSRALKAITECHQALLRASNEAELLAEICRIIVDVGGYRMAWVGFAGQDEAKTVRPAAQKGFDHGYVEQLRITWADTPWGRGPVGTAVRTGTPAICRNTQTDPNFAPWREEARKRGYASVLGLPLKDEATFGALTIYSADPDAFDDEEITLLTGLANDLAYGITALRGRDERRRAQEALRESEEKYRGLMDYASDAILLVDPAGQVTEANRRAEELLGYSQEELLGMDYGEIFPREEADNIRKKLKEIARKGSGQLMGMLAVRKDGRQVPVDMTGSLIKFASKKLTQEILRDITERKQTEAILRDSEQRLRLLASHMLTVQERERWRLARELHDELGQALTVLKIHLVAIEQGLRQDQGRLRRSCEELLQYIDGVIENVRRLSWDLSPSILEDLGLSSSLGYLIDEICRNNRMKSTVTMDEIDYLFSPETQINIYRILQESLTNIVKHAQASHITVAIQRQEGRVSFLIKDNGRGFDEWQAYGRQIHQRSLGLTAMKERALMANGELQVLSQKGKGTRVSFSIPIDH